MRVGHSLGTAACSATYALLGEAENDCRVQAAVHYKLDYLVQIAAFSLLLRLLFRAKGLLPLPHRLLFWGRLKRSHCFLSNVTTCCNNRALY